MKHGCGWEGATLESNAARCGVQRPMRLPTRRCRVWAFFFFFFFHKFVPTWLDSRQLGFNSHRFMPHQADLARIGPYWPNWVVQPATEIGLESCRNSRNQLWIRSKHLKSILPQFYSEYLLLLLCFLFCFLFLAFFFCFVNQGIVMCFLRIF